MAEYSKSRIQADAAFLETQTQFLSRDRIISKSDTVNQARDANTARLKAQRLDKEALDRATSAAAPPPRRAPRKSIKGS
jgi:hypothetical protein